MSDIPIKRVFESIVRLRNYDPDTAALSARDKTVVAELVNDRMTEAWTHDFWDELMLVEQRQYRASWDATLLYTEDDEIYYEDSDGEGSYYVASSLADNTNKQPDTETTFWSVVGVGFVRSISFTQSGESKIGYIDVSGSVFDRDPRIYRDTQPLSDIGILGSNIIVRTTTAPLKPWIKFLPPARTYSWTDWDATTAYAVGDTAYLSSAGDSYTAIASSTGKTPDQQTAYWEPTQFPDIFLTFIKHAVNADQIQEDAEAAGRENAIADRALANLQDRKTDLQGLRRRVVWSSSPTPVLRVVGSASS